MTYGFLFLLGVAVLLFVALIFMSRGADRSTRKEIYEQMEKCYELAKGDTSSQKDAVIRLDSLLGRSLSYAGVKGESVGAKLKNARSLYDRKVYDDIWSAHKIRNKLVHEQYELTHSEAEAAISTLTSAIRRLLK